MRASLREKVSLRMRVGAFVCAKLDSWKPGCAIRASRDSRFLVLLQVELREGSSISPVWLGLRSLDGSLPQRT